MFHMQMRYKLEKMRKNIHMLMELFQEENF